MISEYIDEANHLAVHVLNGTISAKDIIDAVKAQSASGPTLHNLWDLTDADMSRITNDDIQEIALLVKQAAPKGRTGRTAIVSASDLGFGIGRAYSTLAELFGQSVEVQSFRSQQAAKEWISEFPG